MGNTLSIVTWSLVAVLASAALVVKIFFLSEADDAEPASLSRTNFSANTEPENRLGSRRRTSSRLGISVEFDQDSKTGAAILSQTIVPWLNENWHLGRPPEGVDPAGWRDLVNAMIGRILESPDRLSSREVSALAGNLAGRDAGGPLASYLIGRGLEDGDPRKKKLLEQSYRGLSTQQGSEILAYHAAVDWAAASDPDEAEPDEADGAAAEQEEGPAEICLAAMRRALDRHEGFSKFHDRLAGWLLVEGNRDELLEADPEEFFRIVNENQSVKPWLKKWVEGKQFHKIAWDARGGGYWNTVSDSGRALFPRNIEKAIRSMSQAWELSPDHPGVAADLIALAMADSCDQGERRREMLKWFERMTAVQIDFGPGYSNMLWGLRKRWNGEFESMEHFGEMCLDSGRFDSGAPWWYLRALRDTATEWDLRIPSLRHEGTVLHLAQPFA